MQVQIPFMAIMLNFFAVDHHLNFIHKKPQCTKMSYSNTTELLTAMISFDNKIRGALADGTIHETMKAGMADLVSNNESKILVY